MEGDFLKDPLGGPYDFIWISQILHAFPEADCRKLLRKARAALAPGEILAHQKPPEPMRAIMDDVLERMAEHSPWAMPVVSPHTGELLGALTNRDVLSLMVFAGDGEQLHRGGA